MKKIFFLLISIFAIVSFVKAQTVPREMVALEITTSTKCTYCPGAALGAEDLLANGKLVAVIEHHNNWQGSDPYVTTASQARCVTLGAGGNPTAYFDVKLKVVGGDHTQSMYSYYLPKYNSRMAVPSNIAMNMEIANTDLDYTATITMTKVGTLDATNMKLLFTATESHIHYHWQGQDTLNYVNRLMVPDQNGTVVSFASGDTQVITLNFSVDTAWALENVEFIAFVEDMTAKEVLQTVKKAANDLHPEFTASDTAIVVNQPLTFTNETTGGYVDAPETYEWLFPGATPSSSTDRNPTTYYLTAGSYDVTLIVTRGGQVDTLTKTAYITSSWPSGVKEKTNFVNVQIYPNPNNGDFTLKLNPVKSVVADLTVTNTNGTVLYTENGLNIAGKMQKHLKLGNLSPGVYYLNIQNSESKTVQKFIVK